MGKLVIKQSGFSVVYGLLSLVIVGIIGFAGWKVYDSTIEIKKSQAGSNNTEIVTADSQKVSTTSYAIDEFGVSVEIPPGWIAKKEVVTNGYESNDKAFDIQISLTGSIVKISGGRRGFRGGFSECENVDASSPLERVTINQVSKTKNSSLMFIDYEYGDSDNFVVYAGLVNANNEYFYKTSDSKAVSVRMDYLQPGTFYACLSVPSPGFAIKFPKQAESHSSANLDTLRINFINTPLKNTYNERKNLIEYQQAVSILTSVK